MSTVRLVGWMRDQICTEIMDYRYPDRHKPVTKSKYNDLLEEVWKDQLPADLRKRLAELPVGWMKNHNSLYVTFGGEYHYFNFPELGGRRVPDYMTTCVLYDAIHPLTTKFRAIQQEEKDRRDTFNQARNQIMAVLASCSTIKKLLETWPEAASFVEKYKDDLSATQKVKTNLPATLVADLNKEFKLPPQKVAQS